MNSPTSAANSSPNASSTPSPDGSPAPENNPELRQFLGQCLSNLTELQGERAGTNETISAIYAKIKERGIPKKAFKMAMDYAELTEVQQQAFDIAYAIVRQAAGYPLQLDLLDPKEAPPLSVVRDAPPEAMAVKESDCPF